MTLQSKANFKINTQKQIFIYMCFKCVYCIYMLDSLKMKKTTEIMRMRGESEKIYYKSKD